MDYFVAALLAKTAELDYFVAALLASVFASVAKQSIYFHQIHPLLPPGPDINLSV